MGDPISYWPLVVLLIGIAAVILQIVVLHNSPHLRYTNILKSLC